MLKNKGFTLIELMIVISIIAILSAIGLVMYGQFTKSARDAKRQSDLKFIQSALEDYHADNLSYPLLLDDLTTGTRVYLKEMPTAPAGGTYNYTVTPTTCDGSTDACTNYCLSTILETTSSSQCPIAPATPSITTGDNYGVTRP